MFDYPKVRVGTRKSVSSRFASFLVPPLTGILISAGFSFLCPSEVRAQNATVLLPAVIDPEYNRDRNISVTERPHPDYDALGIRLSSFILHPSLAVASVYTSNVYLDDRNKKADVYGNLLPSITIDSDWSNHYIGLNAAGDLRRYVSQTLRNQNAWYVYTQARLDVLNELNIHFDGQLDRSYESPYSEDVVANLTVPSTYLRKFLAMQATYQPGRVRLRAALDVSNFTFSTLQFADGLTRSQTYRNRTVYRASGVYEYALSPSVSLYGQAIYDRTDYDESFIGTQPNRSSSGVAVIAGSNFDLAGIARGSIGFGYSKRSYDASYFYKPSQGVSAQAKIELFPSELTTIGLSLERQLQDSSLSSSGSSSGAFWNNRLAFNVDRELLDNLIVSATAEAVRREYIDLKSDANVYQFELDGRYQASRVLGFNAGLSYGFDRVTGIGLGTPFHELRGTLGVRIRG